MILADKIIKLRKKNGWSQEELAEKMNVSRQAVSKWESAQAIPDLEKILQLGDLFGVTTDYLLKDEIEDEEFTDSPSDIPVKRISLTEANDYLDQRKRASVQIALATFLCIISPITLLILGAASEVPGLGITDKILGIVGLTTLFAFILCAVPIFIYCGFKNEPYAFLDKNVPFELEYGVRGMVSERQKQFRDTYVRWNIIATCICIFSPMPLIVSSFGGNALLTAVMLSIMIALVGVGASIFIVIGVRNASMQKLLREGDFGEREKAKSALKEAVDTAYWGIVLAIYLCWSFLSGDWHITWLTFVIAGALSPLVMHVCGLISDSRSK